MRILFCNFEYPPLGGGGGVVNALLAQELAKTHEVAVLTSRYQDLPAESVEDGVRVIRVPTYFRTQLPAANIPSMAAYVVTGILGGRRLLRKTEFDVINSHFVVPSGPVGAQLSKFANFPHVISVHGGDLYDPSKKMSPHRHGVLRAVIRCLLTKADAIVGQSVNTLDNMSKYYGSDLSGVRIPLGITRPPQGTVERASYGLTDDDMVLATVGRLVPRKAIDQMVAMLPQLSECRAHLFIVGSGPEEPKLKEQAASLGVADRLHCLGFVSEEEKAGVLRMADLFVSTSQHEGFGLVFLEGMACGLPVVCYDHGGQTDFLEDGATGHLVPLNDTAQFSEKCLSLLNDAETRQAMAAENLRRVEDLFIDSCARAYEELFDDVLRKHRDRPHP